MLCILGLNKGHMEIKDSKLAQVYGVPVGRRSGGRLATTLVASKNNILFFSFFLFFSLLSTFLLEGVHCGPAYGKKEEFSTWSRIAIKLPSILLFSHPRAKNKITNQFLVKF